MSKKVNLVVKEKLAKLMAREDITIEHRKVATAMFDVKNRVLILPIWQEMSNELYCLLIGHEVSHALNTPLKELEEAFTQITENGKTQVNKRIKSVINIVEDARIEKMIQRTYPGLRKDFHIGYSELVERGFFNANGKTLTKNISEYNLLDRINIHFKLGTVNSRAVPFSEEERPWVQKVEKCVSFTEVVKVSQELLKFYEDNCPDEDPETSPDEPGQTGEPGDVEQQETGFESQESQSDGSEKSDSQEKSKGKESQESGEDSSEDNSSSGDGENEKEGENKAGAGDESGDDSENESGAGDKESDSQDSDFDSQSDTNRAPDFDNPKYNRSLSETAEHLERRMGDLLDQNGREFHYIDEPLKKQTAATIVPWKEVHQSMRNHWNASSPGQLQFAEECFEKFKYANKPIVSFMAKEFEMKKAAMVSSRIKVSKTGTINMNKLHSYRYNDDIFVRKQQVPKGKNHGLVMFIDRSGSMSHNMEGTIDQLMNLTMFCRKTQIAFRVFGFTNSNNNYESARLNKSIDNQKQVIFDDNFQLREWLSSDMKGVDYRNALINLTALKNSHRYGNGYRNADEQKKYYEQYKDTPGCENISPVGCTRPPEESLCGTPLNQAILATQHIVDEFRSIKALDIVNVVFLTDGEATDMVSTKGGITPSSHLDKIFLRGKKNKDNTEIRCSNYWFGEYNTTKTLVERLQKICNCNAVCFHITGSANRLLQNRFQGIFDNQAEEQKQLKEAKIKFKRDGVACIDGQGFSDYYIIPSGNSLKTEARSLQGINENSKLREIKKIFSDSQAKIKRERVILKKFIDKISKNVV